MEDMNTVLDVGGKVRMHNDKEIADKLRQGDASKKSACYMLNNLVEDR